MLYRSVALISLLLVAAGATEAQAIPRVSYESPRAPWLRQANLVSQSGSVSSPLIDPPRQGSLDASACMGDCGGSVAQFDGERYVLPGIVDRASHPSPTRARGHLTHFVAVADSWSPPATAAESSSPPRRAAKVKKQKKKSIHSNGVDRRDTGSCFLSGRGRVPQARATGARKAGCSSPNSLSFDSDQPRTSTYCRQALPERHAAS